MKDVNELAESHDHSENLSSSPFIYREVERTRSLAQEWAEELKKEKVDNTLIIYDDSGSFLSKVFLQSIYDAQCHSKCAKTPLLNFNGYFDEKYRDLDILIVGPFNFKVSGGPKRTVSMDYRRLTELKAAMASDLPYKVFFHVNTNAYEGLVEQVLGQDYINKFYFCKPDFHYNDNDAHVHNFGEEFL